MKLTGGFFSSAKSTALSAKSSDKDSLSTSTFDSSTSSSAASTISLHSNLSLQTHPSLPSLQQSPVDSLYSSSSAAAVAVLSSNTLRSSRPNLPITSLSLRGDHLYAASGHEIIVYDVRSGTILQSFNGGSGSGSVKSVLFSSDGKLFSAHQDSQIRVWKIPIPTPNRYHHKLIAALPTVSDRLRHFAFPNSYVSVRRHKKILRIQHADAVSALAGGSGDDEGLIYSVSWDRSLKIWSSSTLRCLESITNAHDDAVNAVAVSPDGTVYTGSADRRIRVWARPVQTANRHILIATLEKHKSAVNALTLNDDESILFSGSCDRSILVWEKEDSANHMSVTGALRGHGGAVLCLINVGDLLLSGSGDRTVRIWRRGKCDGKYCCLAVLEGHEKAVKSLAAWDENGVVTVYSGSLDGEIKVWRVEVGKGATKR
ncbi:Protein JINGUBANG [Linum perenne]